MEHSEYREEISVEGYPHSYDHSEPKGSALFIFGGVTVILLILVTIGITFYYDTTREQQVFTKVLTVDNDQLKALRATEAQELHSYGYIDKAAGKVRLPIERAMEIVVKEYAENRLKYPTTPYPVKTQQQQQASSPAVSAPGAAAATAAQEQGASSNPNVQQSTPPHQ